MSGRCRCCNRILFDSEINSKITIVGDEHTDQIQELDEYDDFCNICKSEYRTEYNYIEDHEHVHGTLEDGLKIPDLYKE